jgi:carbon-monoxide dehydrogenase medium subunit
MLNNIRDIIRPASVDEAIERLGEAEGALKPMAGGTAGALFKSRKVTGILDLWSLPLRYLEHGDDGLRIGATTTLGELDRSPVVRGWAGGGLWEAARSAGSTPLRNLITAGGNVAGLYPWSDLPPVLLVLDARARIAGPAGPETRIEDLVVDQHPSSVLGDRSLLTELVVPEPPPGAGTAFIKFAQSKVEYSWLDVAAYVEMNGDRCRTCRFAVGAIEPRCRRLRKVEALVTGSRLDADTLERAGEVAASEVKPSRDARAGDDYRRSLAATLGRRVLVEAARRAAQGGGA